MFGLFGSKNLLGIDIGSSSIKVADIESVRGGVQLNRFGVMPLPKGMMTSGEITDPVAVGTAVQSLIANMRTKKNQCVTGLFGSSVVIKKITMPRLEAQLVAEEIKWAAQQYVPFDINDVSIEYKILAGSSSTESMDVLLIAAKQDLVFRYIECFEVAKVKLSTLDVNGFAIANCFEFNYGVQPGIIGLLNLGAASTNFVVVDRGEVIFSRDIPVGGYNFTNDISQAMNISFEEAEALKISASMGQAVPTEVNNQIVSTNEHYVEEIKASLEFFAAASGSLSISRFYATGGGIYTPGLLAAITKGTGIQYEVMDPFQRVSYNSKNLSAEYIEQIRSLASVAIGLSLRKADEA